MSRRKRFVPGRGQDKRTVVTALRDNVDMSAIDGTILPKKGDTREYDFDMARALRTGKQRSVLANLLRSRYIKLVVQDAVVVAEIQPSVKAQTSIDSSPESMESLESIPQDDDLSSGSSVDPIDSSSSSSDIEEEEAQTSVTESRESPEPTPVTESREQPEHAFAPHSEPRDDQGSDGVDDESVDTGGEDEDPGPRGDAEDEERPPEGSVAGLDEAAIEIEVSRKFDELDAMSGIGKTTIRKLLELDNPVTYGAVAGVPRIKTAHISKIVTILNS